MNRLEQILFEQWHKVTDAAFDETILKHLNYAMLAQEQTALDFSRWKDENYFKVVGLFFMSVKEGDDKLYTNEQLFNEWKNQTI